MRSVAPSIVLVALSLSSCAYYNTYYLARKYYDKGTVGAPYVTENPDPGVASNFGKSIDYSKKVLAQYPKSKWADDAYLLWARALIGKDDPSQTVNMLRDFTTRYPQSPLKDEALFYLGVGARKAHNYGDALSAVEEFLRRQPNHPLTPYAYLEQSRALMGLERPADAAAAASKVLVGFPKYEGRDRALLMRAEALLARRETDGARADFKALGVRAVSDEQRFTYLLREADCLEAARSYDDELALLRDALGHEQEPQRAPVTLSVPASSGQQNVLGGRDSIPSAPPYLPPNASNDRWGRLTIRIGTAHMLAGRKDDAIKSYREVVSTFPTSALSAEAQYRIGYVYETLADDFESARQEYGRLARLSVASPYSVQANQRLANLERLTQVRGTSGTDSLAKKAETGFMLAELYLFQNNKPDRALEQYRKIESDFPGTPWAGKAMTAEAWVLRRKLDRPEEADSLWWVVVRDYPKTEAQLSARDYLEAAGHVVPDSLIQPPEPVPAPPDTSARLTPVPAETDSLGRRRPQAADSLLRSPFIYAGEIGPAIRPGFEERGPRLRPGAADSALVATPPDSTHTTTPPDSTHTATPPDSTHATTRPDSTHAPTPPDSTHAPTPPDSTHAAARPDSSATRAPAGNTHAPAPADTRRRRVPPPVAPADADSTEGSDP